MPVPHFSPNPYDNLDYLRERFRELSDEQKEELFITLSTKFYRERKTTADLQMTVQRIDQQYERALIRINILKKEVQELKRTEDQNED